jgi:hypothetical protein
VDVYETLLRARAVQARRVATGGVLAITALFLVAMAEAPPRGHTPPSAIAVRDATQIGHARERIAARRKEAADERERFLSALAEARLRDRTAPLVSTGSTQPCTTTLPEPSPLAQGRAPYPLVIVAPDEGFVTSPSLDAVLGDLRRAEEHLDHGRYLQGISHLRNLSGRTGPRFDVVVFADVYKRPVSTNASSFEPGVISGKAYLYDFAKHEVTCRADVHVSSSEHVAYPYDAVDRTAVLDVSPALLPSLEADLAMQLETSIARGLVARTSNLHATP